MRNIRLKPMVNDVFYNQFINNIGLHLENKSIKDPTTAIFSEYAKYLHKTLTSEQMSMFQSAFNIPISEMGAISDDEIAKAIADAAKELEDKYPDAKYLENPEKLDVDALYKGDIEHGLGIDDDKAKDKSNTQNEGLLKEAAWMAALAAPSILKLISKIIEWLKRQSVNDAELKLLKITKLIYKTAKKGKLPDRKGLWKAAEDSDVSVMYALYPDMEKGFQKDLDIVLKRIYDALEEKKKKDPKTYGHSKFSAEADTVQEIDNHLLHLIDELTYASKGAKNIANIGHKLHELFITPLKAIVTAIIAMKYGVLKKESWKRAWGESETWANRVYIGAMFALLGIEGFHALMAHGGNIAAILKSTFGSIDKLAAAAKNTIKASDMASATADDILALAGAGEEAVGAV